MLFVLIAALASPADSAGKANDSRKKVCVDETETGSSIARRVCHTRSEWAAMAVSNGRDRDAFRDRATNMTIPR